MRPIDLTNKAIVISGASSGIGAATAVACAQAGMKVALGARRRDKLERVAEEIVALGGEHALVCEIDVADRQQCEAFVDAAVERFGGVYAVFANAGYGAELGVMEMTDEQIRRMFDVNFFGSLDLVRAGVEHFRRRGRAEGEPLAGHALFCSSCVSNMPLPYYSVYSATKACQAHVAAGMRFELAEEHVAVSSVHPIGTNSEFFDQVRSRSDRKKLIDHTPDSKLQSPAFVAGQIVNCLRRPRREVWPGWQGLGVRLGMAITGAFPGIGDGVLRKQVKQRLERD